MKLGQTMGRFRVKATDFLDEYQSTATLFEEELSGAQIYHIHNDDEENLFSFNFGTLPQRSDGIAHILEHSVLCGSERYPVKDPFFMLYKGSMQTFLNAMTFPDKTVYPAASTVKQDLFNLMSVYADAVFFPLLRRGHFLQEGHRLGLNSEGQPEISGIVYNEMKAHYSTQDSIAGEWCYRSLLPDTPYNHDSGGNPAEIPFLSHEDFCAFHKTYYHPSNCLIFLYGNIKSEEYLALLDTMVFSRFTPNELKKRSTFAVPLQPAWTHPRTLEVSYPVSSEEDNSSSVNLNWLLPEPQNSVDLITMEILSDVLLATPASPIQKLILESDLGEDMSSTSGLESDLRQPVFTIGMRGTDRNKAEKIEALILGGLNSIANTGIDNNLLQASIRRFEFRSREIKGSVPFGLRLLMRTLKRWLHGDAPSASVKFTPYLEELKLKIRENPNIFTDIIQHQILKNPHRSRAVIYPDPGQNTREEAEEQQRINDKVRELGEGALEKLKENTRSFQQFQQQADSPEDIEKIPFLSVNDIPRGITTIPHRSSELRGHPLHIHELFTNEISYIDFGFKISHIRQELQLFLPFLFHLLPQLGTGKKPYTQMATEWGLKTGGFSMFSLNSTDIHNEQQQHAYIRLKTLDSMSAEGLSLLGQIIQDADFSKHRYIWELFSEYRNDFRSHIIPNGTSYASIRARRGISQQAYTDDLLQGLIQSHFIENIYAQGKNVAPLLADSLSTLTKLIFDPSHLNLVLVSGADQSARICAQLDTLLSDLERGFSTAGRGFSTAELGNPGGIPEELLPRDILSKQQAAIEGIQYSTKINFTALALKASHITEREQIHEHILAHTLSTGILHEKIRMEGGAYGAFCSPSPLSGTLTFGSYRDPAIVRSWKAYEDCLRICASHPIDQKSLDLAKISLAGRELAPLSPSEKGIVSFRRLYYGINDDLRKQRRLWLIDTSISDVQRAAERLLAAMNGAYRTVLADPEALKALSAEIPELERVSMS